MLGDPIPRTSAEDMQAEIKAALDRYAEAIEQAKDCNSTSLAEDAMNDLVKTVTGLGFTEGDAHRWAKSRAKFP